MARSTEAFVDGVILEWARSSAGLSIEDAARVLNTRPEKLQTWEDGSDSPSMPQLRKMAVAYKRLLSDFYLPAPPPDEALPHDFRRLPGEAANRYSRALRYQLRAATQRRELALDFADELEEPPPQLTDHLSERSDTEKAGAELRAYLDVPLALQKTWRTDRASYNGWRSAIERKGILVFQAASIPTTEMLGFSLGERPLPVIGVNRKLTPNGRIFTLLHECVHIFLGESSICDIEEGVQRPPKEQWTEVFCNGVAGAALVPMEALLREPLTRSQPGRREWSSEELAVLARNFGVSQHVILRRLLTAGRTTEAFYKQRLAAWGSVFKDAAPTDPEADFRRNMPQEIVSDLGKPFTRLVVNSYLNSFTSLSDVSRHLGLRATQLPKVQALLAAG